MKKVLILSVTAGNGHNAIGRAIEDEFKLQGCETQFLDVFKEFSGEFKVNVLDKIYMFVCQHLITPYNFIYKKLLQRNPDKWKKIANSKFIRGITPKLYNYILEYKPDIIVSTHVFNAIMLSNIKRVSDLPCTTYGVVTDYIIHPFWEASALIDYLITPTEDVRVQALQKGFSKNQVKTIGIPVKKKFSKPHNKIANRKSLGLDESMFTVLVVLSKARFGSIKKLLLTIVNTNLPIQIIVVNGNNSKSKKTVNKMMKNNKFKHKILNLGFVNNIEVLMSASNIIISKAGATTLNEALNIGLPMFIKCKLPYQEIFNTNFLAENNAGVYVSSNKHLQILLRKSLKDENFLINMQNNINKIKRVSADKDFVGFALNNMPEKAVYTQVKLPEKTIRRRIIDSLKFY